MDGHNLSRQVSRLVTILLFYTTLCITLAAQNYPIQATLTIAGPYSLTIEDYIAPNDNRLQLNLWLKDINVAQYPVRLRVTISTGRGQLVTRSDYLPAPLYLQGGIPLLLHGYDIASYFDINNLTFQGISKEDYLRTRKLPEGLYRFSVEVLDYYRGTVVSNTAFFSGLHCAQRPTRDQLSPQRQQDFLYPQSPDRVQLDTAPHGFAQLSFFYDISITYRRSHSLHTQPL